MRKSTLRLKLSEKKSRTPKKSTTASSSNTKLNKSSLETFSGWLKLKQRIWRDWTALLSTKPSRQNGLLNAASTRKRKNSKSSNVSNVNNSTKRKKKPVKERLKSNSLRRLRFIHTFLNWKFVSNLSTSVLRIELISAKQLKWTTRLLQTPTKLQKKSKSSWP